MFPLPVLYCICIFATRIGPNVIGSPSQPPSLTFQVEPDSIPPSSFDSSETWPDNASASQDHSSDHEFDTTFKPLQQHDASFDRPPIVWYNAFLPAPVGLPFFNRFQNAVARFFSFSVANSGLNVYHHLPEPIDCSKYTIGEVLEWTLLHTPKPSGDDSHHPPPLHRLAWLVNISHPVREALHNPDADFTLFAPDDKALTPPKKKRHHAGSNQLEDVYEATQEAQIMHTDASHTFWDALEAIENDSGCPHMRQVEEDDDDDTKKKKFFLHAIEMVLKYHISPGRKTLHEIVDSSTLPTELRVLPISESAKFRVRVGPPHFHHPGSITLNFFSKLDAFKNRPIIAKNGIIYIIERVPLLPPLSPLSQLFLYPHKTSTLTSALQKTHLDDVLLPHWGNKTIPLSSASNLNLGSSFDDSLENVDERVQSILTSLIDSQSGDTCKGKLRKGAFTVFAPTNHAFDSLGAKANAFLFSPFGQRILRYVLSYHIVPHVIWHTDHCDEAYEGQRTDCNLESQTDQMVEPFHPSEDLSVRNQYAHPHYPLEHHPRKVNITKLFLPTLLGSRVNESLPISLVEFRPFRKSPLIRRVYISSSIKEDAIPVIIRDGVAWGGAIHMLPKLIHPPVPEGHHHRKDVQRAVELSILI